MNIFSKFFYKNLINLKQKYEYLFKMYYIPIPYFKYIHIVLCAILIQLQYVSLINYLIIRNITKN